VPVVRKTIVLPASVAARIERDARRRGTSFSAMVTEILRRSRRIPPYAAGIDDDPDLSLRVGEILSRLHD